MSATAPHRIGILVFDGAKMLDIAGPSEVFAEASLSDADYRISMLSTDGNDVDTSIGLRLPVGRIGHFVPVPGVAR